MPRKPKFVSALRKLETAVGLPRKEFIHMLGIPSLNTYDKMVNKGIGLTREKLKVIYLRTGADQSSLLFDSPGPVASWKHAPYATGDFEEWSRISVRAVNKWDHRSDQICSWVVHLFEAARDTDHVEEVFTELCDKLTELRKNYGMVDASNRLLLKHKFVQEWKYSVGLLRKHESLAALVGYKDKPHYPEDALFTATKLMKTPWMPGTVPLPPKYEPKPLPATTIKLPSQGALSSRPPTVQRKTKRKPVRA